MSAPPSRPRTCPPGGRPSSSASRPRKEKFFDFHRDESRPPSAAPHVLREGCGFRLPVEASGDHLSRSNSNSFQRFLRRKNAKAWADRVLVELKREFGGGPPWQVEGRTALLSDEICVPDAILSTLFHAKCSDLNIPATEERRSKFACRLFEGCSSAWLDLTDCGLSLESAKALSLLLLESGDRFVSLALSKNRLGDDGTEVVASLLRMDENITHLDLSSNAIGARGGLALFESVRMKKNRIGAAGATPLRDVLRVNQVLGRAVLQSNSLGPVGMSHLANGVSRNAALTHLDVSSNAIGPAGAAALAQSV
uniref:Uncharacterized protein n=1 Tax=Chromera velia CCMP2878 TaxID=1169474 RepID=A0A0K6S7T4_9ALVE|eukprot:Cvel_23058.t1-p1 / transcript=Cvel_23058.t1 / gene=Cvel_23058 / organism=Chromera_velia_CCMP2878 / gene_product=Protein NLRC3, putative / transcript_product=Protein NLRC3, putative / location=Cvel_scaffold2334:5932-8412(-) / protein_length=309 / sequence_SO=supercontig / SO=protein_coding / is_pseudo=false